MRSAKAEASRPKHSAWPNTSGVSIPISRTLPIPLSQSVSPSVVRVTLAACVEFDAVASGCVLVPQLASAMLAASAARALIVGAEAVPAVQLERLGGELCLALL